MDINGITRIQPQGDELFDRVVSILEQARANVVRSINNNMVIAIAEIRHIAWGQAGRCLNA